MGKKKDKNKVIYGDAFANEITGTDGNDKIIGLGGDDTIEGGAGNDQIWGDSNGSGKGTGSGKGSHGGSKASHGGRKDSHHGSKASHHGSKASDGEPGNDYLDGGAGNDKLWGGAGDDTAAYKVAENDGAHDKYKGGAGDDTLLLMMTEEEYNDPTFQQNLTEYLAILADDSNSKKKFHFDAFDLKVESFENLEFDIATPAPDPMLADDVFSDLQIDDAYWLRPLFQVYQADVLLNDSGVTDDDGLIPGVTIQVIESSVPDSIESIRWNEAELVFDVFIGATEDGDSVDEEFIQDAEGGQITPDDPVGVSFEYEALVDGIAVDSATVDLFIAD